MIPFWPVPLRGRGGVVRAVACVDEDVWKKIDSNGWRYQLHPNGYAQRQLRDSEGTGTTLLHRDVLGLGWSRHRTEKVLSYEVDHVNRDKLDCRRENLRLVDRKGNMANSTWEAGRSGVPGVHFHLQTGKWCAWPKKNGRRVYGGIFKSIEEAARFSKENSDV